LLWPYLLRFPVSASKLALRVGEFFSSLDEWSSFNAIFVMGSVQSGRNGRGVRVAARATLMAGDSLVGSVDWPVAGAVQE